MSNNVPAAAMLCGDIKAIVAQVRYCEISAITLG